MAISKKEAKRAVAVVRDYIAIPDIPAFLGELAGLIKNKGFRKSLKRMSKALEQPKKGRMKKAA